MVSKRNAVLSHPYVGVAKWSPFCCFAQLNQNLGVCPLTTGEHAGCLCCWLPGTLPIPCQDVPCENTGALTPSMPVFRNEHPSAVFTDAKGRLWYPREGAAVVSAA